MIYDLLLMTDYLWFVIYDLSNGKVDEEVNAAVDGQTEMTHTKQPAEK